MKNWKRTSPPRLRMDATRRKLEKLSARFCAIVKRRETSESQPGLIHSSDVIFGWRQLWKNKTTTAVAILSLALAMGACLAAFRLIDAILLRSLPVSNAKKLFVLTFAYLNAAGQTEIFEGFDYPQFRILRAAVKPQAELIAISQPSRYSLTFNSDDRLERFLQQSVSG